MLAMSPRYDALRRSRHRATADVDRREEPEGQNRDEDLEHCHRQRVDDRNGRFGRPGPALGVPPIGPFPSAGRSPPCHDRSVVAPLGDRIVSGRRRRGIGEHQRAEDERQRQQNIDGQSQERIPLVLAKLGRLPPSNAIAGPRGIRIGRFGHKPLQGNGLRDIPAVCHDSGRSFSTRCMSNRC